MRELAVKWASRYGAVQLDYYDSVEVALSVAAGAREDGAESLHFIEVWDAAGYHLLDREEVYRLLDESEERRPPISPPEPIVARLFVTSPEGERVLYSGFTDAAHAVEVAARLREHMGDRVELVEGSK